MKAVILAGGFGTRISEESYLKPKPMIEIGGKPILWHIMKEYSHYGVNEFIICAGYKQECIKDFFYNYYLHTSDVRFDFSSKNSMTILKEKTEPWIVNVIDTGLNTMTGGRIKRVKELIGNETFMLTYGDGVSDVNISKLLEYHKANKKLVTITTVQPGGRFGTLQFSQGNTVSSFCEKKLEDGGWINAGYMVIEPEVIDYIAGDETTFEREPLEALAKKSEICAYKHSGFWQCMDTIKDKNSLEKLWNDNKADWKVWND